jgi:hypothetical protein
MHRHTNWLAVFLCLLLISSFGTSEHVSIPTATGSATHGILHETFTQLIRLPPSVSANEALAPTALSCSTGAVGWNAIPRGGGYLIPAGWNPFGYKITTLGETFLSFDGSLDGDVGRFLASLKSGRKRMAAMKAQWLEVVRVSKSGQTMRVYRQLQELLDFCLRAGLVD